MNKVIGIIMGRRLEGEAIKQTKFTTYTYHSRPDFNTWCKEFKVSTRCHQDASYYELNPPQYVSQ
jgi:hypothetical protein